MLLDYKCHAVKRPDYFSFKWSRFGKKCVCGMSSGVCRLHPLPGMTLRSQYLNTYHNQTFTFIHQ